MIFSVLTACLSLALAFTACPTGNDPIHNHNWGNWVVTTAPTCTTQGIETRVCTDPSHTETRYISINPNAHSWGNWTQTKAPTETVDGEETRTCSFNTAHKETHPITALNHTHVWGAWTQTTAPTCTTDGVETRTCSLNQSHIETRPGASALGHDWGEWEVTIAPTATEGGVDTRTCTHDASHAETRNTSATGEPGHTHDWGEYEVTTAATCTTAGVKTMTCKTDATHKETQPIEALGHNYGNWMQTAAPTCTTTGIETRTCSLNASHTEIRPLAINSTAHSYGSWMQTIAPTCTTAGIETRTCILNATHTETRSIAIDPSAHNYDNWTQTTVPTCTTAGVETRTCTLNTSHTETHIIVAIGHTIADGSYLCSLCNNPYKLGDTGPGGGIIFYRSENGFTMTDDNTTAHYFEVAPADSGSFAWASSGNTETLLSGTFGTAIGTGRANTSRILQAGNDPNAPAAKACNDYSYGGKTDWFLPSTVELSELLVNNDSVSNLGSYYWSSTQFDMHQAYTFSSITGTRGLSLKPNYTPVRAIRAF